MYAPQQIGMPNQAHGQVVYKESLPPPELRELLYCTWELRVTAPLPEDFMYLVLPDICTDIIFDLQAAGPEKAFVMASGSSAQEINLGRSFHYVGIRFFPGVLKSEYVQGSAQHKELTEVWQRLSAAATEAERQTVLTQYVTTLLSRGDAAKNYLMYQVVAHSEELQSVADIEALTGYTRRQLQRIFREQTGLPPRDFLKVVRFQQALASGARDTYADQSHFIKEFKRITGLTPSTFKARY
jgi:AraC-like DNA-binding protein